MGWTSTGCLTICGPRSQVDSAVTAMSGIPSRPTSGEHLVFAPGEWAAEAARTVHGAVAVALSQRAECSVMLTGGASASKLYGCWAAMPEFAALRGVTFYFGDERCVAPDHPESNYGMTRRALFANGVPPSCRVERIEADDVDSEDAASRYAALLPASIDVLLLGVGEDGHVASLFPGSASLGERSRAVIHTVGPKPPIERLTITPPVIEEARRIFVLAPGEGKAAILARALAAPDDRMACPAVMALRGTWMLDSAVP